MISEVLTAVSNVSLRCDDLCSCRRVPTFRRNVLPPSAGLTKPKTLGLTQMAHVLLCIFLNPSHRQQESSDLVYYYNHRLYLTEYFLGL
jgi:hypothetical protein